MKKIKVVTEPLLIKSIHFDKSGPLYQVAMIVPSDAIITIKAFRTLIQDTQSISKITGGLNLCSELWSDKYPKGWLYFEAQSKEKPGCVNKDMDYAEFKTFKAGNMARLSLLLKLNVIKNVVNIVSQIKAMQLVD